MMTNGNENRIDPSQVSPEIRSQIDGIIHDGRAQLVGPSGNKIDVPPALNDLLIAILEGMKMGKTMVLIREDETFTTQAAANFLGMSRPYFIRILQAGKIPYSSVGTHRRIKFSDLVEFKNRQNEQRAGLLTAITKELDSANVYDRRLDTQAE